jgi:hypothetical protein
MSQTVTRVCRTAADADAEGDVAGAAGDVEMARRAASSAGFSRSTMTHPSRCGAGPPTSGRSSGRSGGDLVEHVVHEVLLLAERRRGEAEMGLGWWLLTWQGPAKLAGP